MPFLIRKTDSPEDPETWVQIPTETVLKLRDKFIARHHELVNAGGPDFKSDFAAIKIKSSFFNALVQSAQKGHYLVTQYIVHPDDKTLTIALCIKQKSPRVGVDDTIIGLFLNTDGTSIDDLFYPSHIKYLTRRALAAHFYPAFAKDREGRAHLIVPEMKEAVHKMYQNSDTIYCYFILDDKIDAVDTMSIVFSDTEVSLESTLTDANMLRQEKDLIINMFDAYDHGTACCPID